MLETRGVRMRKNKTSLSAFFLKPRASSLKPPSTQVSQCSARPHKPGPSGATPEPATCFTAGCSSNGKTSGLQPDNRGSRAPTEGWSRQSTDSNGR